MTENELKLIEKKTGKNWLSMTEASRRCSYSQEYLSLLARRGKIYAQKIGRNWYTTTDALNDYLKKQSLTITVPRNVIGRLTSSLTPEEPEGGEDIETGHERHSKVFEEFERLNPQLFKSKSDEEKTQIGHSPFKAYAENGETTETAKTEGGEAQKEVLSKLDQLSESLGNFAERITRKIEEPKEEPLTPEQNEFFDIEVSSRTHRFKVFDRYARSLMSNPTSMMAVMITAVVVIFLLAGGFSFGQADYVVQQIRNAFKDADTLQGHFPGTHANEVLVLDKAGNVSIFGHIETQGQLRSRVENGIAPIVVDSMTKVENLNADYFDDLDSKDFTLAFVTKNGNITTENVFLDGNVEVGKTLTVKGAFKLMNSLDVYGRLGVFGEAVFGKNITLTGGDLVLEKGTIKISNPSLIKNLNAEFLDGLRKGDINLDLVVSNGATTSKSISVGGITSSGPGFFESSIWSPTASFKTLGVGGDASFGKVGENVSFEVYSNRFSLDRNGNVNFGGSLIVGGSVKSDLIPSGSFDLGSAANPWDNIFGNTATFNNLVVSGSSNFAGTSSSSFRINTDNATADTEDSYLSFERGTTTPNATLKWNSTNNRFEFNEPLFIASSSTQTIFSVSGGPASISNTLYVENTGNVGIGTTVPIQKLQINDTATAAFVVTSAGQVGIGTTSPTTKLDVIGAASVSSHFEIGDATDGSDYLVVNSQIKSHLIPFDNTRDVGSATNRWRTVFADKIDATEITGASVSFGGTNNETFTINADNATADTENSQFVFERGSPTTNAQFQWDATNKRFNLNFPVFIQTADPSETTNNFTKLILKGTADQGSNDYFEIQNAGGSRLLLVEEGGRLVASGSFQAGGNSVASVSYSRFGTNTTGHGLSSANDLLISGKLEVDGDIYFDGTVSITTASASNFYAQPGTAASPSFSFIADQDTGMFRPAVNQLGFSTLGAERMRIDSTGNVGIGETGPGNLLHIRNTSAVAGPNLEIDSSLLDGSDFMGGVVFSIIGLDRAAIRAKEHTADRYGLEFQTFDGTTLDTKMTILGNGNVGIGTTAPVNKLHVVGTSIISEDTTANATSKTSKFGSEAYTIAQNPFYTLLSTAESADNTVFLGGGASDGQAATILKFYTASAINTAIGTERMRITATGNVGIGTTSPIALTHIVGDIATLFNVASGSNSRFIVLETGNVGIGTTNPTTKLDVIGNASVSQDFEIGGNLIVGGNLSGGTSISGNFTPITDNTYSLGSNDLRWKDVHVGPGSFRISSTTGTSGTTANYTLGTLTFGSGSSLSFGTQAVGTGNKGTLEFRTDNTARMYISGTGNVGIGTTGPGAKLEVNGTILGQSTITSLTTFQSQSGNDLRLNAGSVNRDIFMQVNGSTLMTVQGSTGNVGIGATGPNARLEVQVPSTTAL
ncbi:MAG: hypothetical protein WD989_02035, partial [Candidatus Paceibacterota bacterium]